MPMLVFILLLLIQPLCCASKPIDNNALGVHITNAAGRIGLLWSSIGLAVVTSLLQGLITTIVTIAEDQNMWTFRFRIARFEHWWWTAISFLLSTSFSLIVISFLSGNNTDSLGVLALSTATAIAIVRYAIPAWRNRHFIENRWLAWTGSSRTTIDFSCGGVCGDAKHWQSIADVKSGARMVAAPSDLWGWAIRAPPGLWQDPTALLSRLGEKKTSFLFDSKWPLGPCVFDDGLHADSTGQVSLLWGED